MNTEILGIRRLYDALGCNAREDQAIHVSCKVAGDMNLSVYLGPNPPLGIMTIDSDQYGIPGKESKIMNSYTDYKSDCFLEIVLSYEQEVDKKAKKGIADKDKNTREELLSIILNPCPPSPDCTVTR